MKQNLMFDTEEDLQQTPADPLDGPLTPSDPNVDPEDFDRLTGQNETIRDVLKACGMIRNRVARDMYSIERLAARIKELRNRGMNITTRKIYRDDPESGKKKFIDTEYTWDDYDPTRRQI